LSAAKNNVPPEMKMKIGIYLTFDGNCKEAMSFYKGVFGGEFAWQQSWGESPMKDETPEESKHLMMHCSLPLSKIFTLMACDRHPAMHKNKHVVGNNAEISLSPETKDEADRLFAALSEGGTVDKPLKGMFWGSYFGTCKDKYGIQWMFDTAVTSKDGKAELKLAAAALREAAEQANGQAEKLEKLAQEPHAKKLKFESKGLENA
jgi:PhnB protein